MAGQYSIAVTLTNVNRPDDVRYLTLTSGEPVKIGRASKVESKNLQPSSTNALFASPVVSRIHAELRAHPWAPTEDQVTITDKASMHGTYVNGKAIGTNVAMSLRSGDRIRFGANVTRSDASHDGIIVTFYNHGSTGPSMLGSTLTPSTSRGFQVPDFDSDEESDDVYSPDSDAEGADNEHVTSSPNTTPEKTRTHLGSAARPIDVDNINRPPFPTVINLDEDEEYIPPPPIAKSYNTQPNESLDVVPESINQGGVWAPLSPAIGPPVHKLLGNPAAMPTADLMPSVDRQQKEIDLPNDDVANVVRAASGPQENIEDYLEDEEESDMAKGEQFEDLHDYSEGDAAEVDEIPFEDDEPHSYSIQRQVSLELESPPASQGCERPPLAPLGLDGMTYGIAPFEPLQITASQRTYDPVRGSQTTAYPSSLVHTSQTLPPMPTNKHIDMLPHGTQWPNGFDHDAPPSQPASSGLSATRDSDLVDLPAFKDGWSHFPNGPFRGVFVPDQRPAAFSSWVGEESGRGTKAQMNRITIPELVDEIIKEPHLTPQKGSLTLDMNVSGSSGPIKQPDIYSTATEGAATGKKRKADAISTDKDASIIIRESQSEVLRETTQELFKTLDKAQQDLEVQEPTVLPARKKLRPRRQPTVVGQAMKYAAAAVVGGAATFAFLLAPIADWVAPGNL